MTQTSNRLALWLSALVAASFLSYSASAHACGAEKGGCGCNKPSAGGKMVPAPEGQPACGAHANTANGGKGCGCAGAKQEPKLKIPEKKAEKADKEARAGWLI